MEKFEEILHYWFGHIEETVLPTQHRTRIWFGREPEVDEEIRGKFKVDLEKAIAGGYDQWKDNSRSLLALIILFDQFSRSIYRTTAASFAHDQRALDLCVGGIE